MTGENTLFVVRLRQIIERTHRLNNVNFLGPVLVLVLHHRRNDDVFVSPCVERACEAAKRIRVDSPVGGNLLISWALIAIEFLIRPRLQPIIFEFRCLESGICVEGLEVIECHLVRAG
jgi:hypothetical protein